MARFTGGYIRWHRRILSGSLKGDGHAQHVLCVLTMMANRKDGEELLRRQRVKVKRTQVSTSLDELVRETGFSKTILADRLKRLETLGSISQKVTLHGRIITVNGYEDFQPTDTDGDTDRNTDGDTDRDTDGSTHIGEKEKKKKREKEKPKKLGPPPSDFDLTLAQEWAALAKSRSPNAAINPAKYADAIRRLQSSVGLTEIQVRETFAWIQTSEFWVKNALSPVGLFNVGKSGLRKIDTIRAQMLEERGPKADDYDWDKICTPLGGPGA